MTRSSIEWTDATWNPVTGCTKVSPGCAHCYAESIAHRFWGARRFTDVHCHEDRLAQPLSWRKPRRVFVNSMSDLFHEQVPVRFIDKIFTMMGLASTHTFQVLTKRPARMRAYCSDPASFGRVMALSAESTGGIDGVSRSIKHRDDGLPGFHLPNVWLGASVENQATANERIPLLLETPAAVRFVSAEPLLDVIDLDHGGFSFLERLTSPTGRKWPRLDWVIVGGESGPNARPTDVTQIRSVVDQCHAAGVPVFVKQLGAVPVVNGVRMLLKNRKGADPAEWPEDLRYREWPP